MITKFKIFEKLNDGYYYELIKHDSEIAIILSLRKIYHKYKKYYNKGISFDWLDEYELPINLKWILKNTTRLYIIFDNVENRYYFCSKKEIDDLLTRKNLKNMGIIKVTDEEIDFYKNINRYNL